MNDDAGCDLPTVIMCGVFFQVVVQMWWYVVKYRNVEVIQHLLGDTVRRPNNHLPDYSWELDVEQLCKTADWLKIISTSSTQR